MISFVEEKKGFHSRKISQKVDLTKWNLQKIKTARTIEAYVNHRKRTTQVNLARKYLILRQTLKRV